MIEPERGAAEAERMASVSYESVLVLATTRFSADILPEAEVVFLKIYEAPAAKRIPGWKRRIC